MYATFYRHLWLPFFDRVLKRRDTLAHWARFEQSQWWPRAYLEAEQLRALQALIAHADETCPYYRDLWRERGLAPRTLQSFADFEAWPLVRRETIREHRNAMRSTLPLSRISKATGGSSGEPLQFDLDTGSNDRRTALMWRGYGWAGGAPGTKQLYIWGGALGNVPRWKRWKSDLHAWTDRRKVINCFEFTPERMERHWAALNRYRPDVIIAYTNPLYEFARFLQDSALVPCSPHAIIVGAEKIHGFQRQLIEEVFRAPVFETYGSREFMLIGAECNRHSGLHLSHENLYVEILDDEGRPTPDGAEGNVVVTDLFNRGMPFIRYVNGDRARAGWKMCACGRGLPLLEQVTGRRLDTLRTPDGRSVPGEFFPHLLKEFPAVRRFQVLQESAGTITLKLVAVEFSEDSERRLRSEIRACVGDTVSLDIQRVDDIPLTRAGKLQVVVSSVGR